MRDALHAGSQASREEQYEDHDEQNPTDAGRPVAVGVESHVRETTQNYQEQHDE